MDQNNIDLGIAGSLTMIVLTVSIGLLLWSFYRRYKRLEKSQSPSASSENNSTSQSPDVVDEK